MIVCLKSIAIRNISASDPLISREKTKAGDIVEGITFSTGDSSGVKWSLRAYPQGFDEASKVSDKLASMLSPWVSHGSVTLLCELKVNYRLHI